MTDHTPSHSDHEHGDVRTSLVMRSAIGFVAVCIAIAVVVWLVYGYLRSQDEVRDARRSLIPAAPVVPPEPRLQVNPPNELQQYKQEQNQILNSYGWVSRDDGRVHIPIERAMDLIVERGFPPREKTEEKK